MGVQEVRWDKGGKLRAGDCNFLYGKGNKHHQLGTGFFVHHRRVSAVKRVEFVSDRMSYIDFFKLYILCHCTDILLCTDCI